jgi:hypothetical protein
MLRQLLSIRRCRLKSRFKVFLKMTAATMTTTIVVKLLAMSNDVQTTEQRRDSLRNLRQETKLPLSGEQTVRGYNLQANQTYTAEQETVHLALVVLSVGDARNVAALLKTVIYFRRVPLYLHVFVNNQTNHIISTLLGTWQLSRANYTLYKLQKKSKCSSNQNRNFYWKLHSQKDYNLCSTITGTRNYCSNEGLIANLLTFAGKLSKVRRTFDS